MKLSLLFILVFSIFFGWLGSNPSSASVLSGWFGDDLKSTNDGIYTDNGIKASIALPKGWHVKVLGGVNFSATKHGFDLQSIFVGRFNTDDALENTKKKLNQKMLIQDQAQVIIDNIKNSKNITNFTLESNKPARIGKYQGFRLVYTYRNINELTRSSIHYGVMKDGLLYSIIYTASKRHYYDKYLEDFEKAAQTFSVIE